MELRFTAVVCAVLAGLLSLGCEGGGEEPERGPAAPISGDATLVIENHTDCDLAVYFDGSYIGEAQEDETTSFPAPAGRHRVLVDAQVNNSVSAYATCTLEPGKNTRVRVTDGETDWPSLEDLELRLELYDPEAPSA